MLFQPDPGAAPRFFALRLKHSEEPEHRLAMAILRDAIECYQKHLFADHHTRRQLFVDAEAWIMSTDREYFFSFENICDLLDISPVFLRRGLLDWRARQRTAPGRLAIP